MFFIDLSSRLHIRVDEFMDMLVDLHHFKNLARNSQVGKGFAIGSAARRYAAAAQRRALADENRDAPLQRRPPPSSAAPSSIHGWITLDGRVGRSIDLHPAVISDVC